jgi:hypothetical protein
MLAAWIYNNPSWIVTSTFVIVALAFNSLVMASVHRLANHALRHEHRELTCFTVSNISVLYAVLLAFIAVATWENFERASETVETEADLANNLCRDTRGFDQPVATSLQHDIRRYLAVVIKQEWPIQQNGGIPSAGWRELDRIHDGIAALTPNSPGETVLMQEMLHLE